MSFLRHCPPCFLRQGLLPSDNLSSRLGWLCSEPQGPTHLYLDSPEIPSTHHHSYVKIRRSVLARPTYFKQTELGPRCSFEDFSIACYPLGTRFSVQEHHGYLVSTQGVGFDTKGIVCFTVESLNHAPWSSCFSKLFGGD